MNWNQTYSKSVEPTLEDIDSFVNSSLWRELCNYLEQSYHVLPIVEHSICSGAPGWNVKYRKNGRALCTLYPDEGSFTALVTIGTREAAEAELLQNTFSDYMRNLYAHTMEHNGTKWLMIRVDDDTILSDAKTLIALRVPIQK